MHGVFSTCNCDFTNYYVEFDVKRKRWRSGRKLKHWLWSKCQVKFQWDACFHRPAPFFEFNQYLCPWTYSLNSAFWCSSCMVLQWSVSHIQVLKCAGVSAVPDSQSTMLDLDTARERACNNPIGSGLFARVFCNLIVFQSGIKNQRAVRSSLPHRSHTEKMCMLTVTWKTLPRTQKLSYIYS